MKYYDLTPVISNRLAVFPGDVRFQQNISMDHPLGHHLKLSSITSTLHLGAHADSSDHYHRKGEGIDKRPLEPYIGPAQVIEVQIPRGARIHPKDVREEFKAPRVLFKTNSFPDPETWNSDFNSFSTEILQKMADSGVTLVGIDTPSVDPHDSKALEAHQILFERNLCVLEGLVLKDVPPGLYTLIALPLPIENADASPVRAILVQPSLW